MVRRSSRRVFGKRAFCEQLEFRRLLSGTYVVSEVPDVAFTQPYVNYFIRGTPNGPPIQYDNGFGPEINQTAFLDTGTSGMVFSQTTTDTYQIEHENVNGTLSYTGGNPVVFTDIGISGGQGFQVSEPLYTAIAPTNDPNVDNPSSYSVYSQAYGPLVTELNPIPDPLADFFGATDIFGMPVMQNKVVVMDTRPYFDSIQQYGLPLVDMSSFIYNPNTPYNPNDIDFNPGIPTANMLQVQMSYADFAPYTSIDPSNAIPPVLLPNPIIGPNPLPNAPPSSVPPLSLSLGQYSTTGSFLFDTGAQVSFLSQAEAANLHVHYRPGTYLTAAPILVDDNNNPIPNQSTVPLQGTDPNNPVSAAQFYIDSLTLQTIQGTPIRFQDVPIVVLDIGLEDPNTGISQVLDGDFGANFLLSSMNGGNNAAFNFITFDQPHGTLNFQPAGSISPGTASVVGRKIFYNNSLFDGNNPAANALDDAAIAPDKVALLSGHTPGLANFTSYSKGINGVMIDIGVELAGAP